MKFHLKKRHFFFIIPVLLIIIYLLFGTKLSQINKRKQLRDLQVFFITLDTSGYYSIKVRALGYQTIEKKIGISGKELVDFVLEEEIYNLESIELISSWIKPDQPFTYTSISKSDLTQKNVGQDVPFLLRWK